jgi:hypothetical protein
MALHLSELSVDAAAEVSRQARLRFRGNLENDSGKVRISYLLTASKFATLPLQRRLSNAIRDRKR